MNTKQIGIRIAKARKQQGLTLKMLGEVVGVHQSQVSRIERGEARLLGKNLQKICKYLGLNPLEQEPMPQHRRFVDRVQALLEGWPQGERVLNAMLDALEESLEGDRRSG